MTTQEKIEELIPKKKECRHKIAHKDSKFQQQPCACILKDVGGFNEAHDQFTAILPKIEELIRADERMKLKEAIDMYNTSFQDYLNVCELFSKDNSRTGVETEVALKRVKQYQFRVLELLTSPSPLEDN